MIKIFVGCSANHEDAESQAVLEWSIAKHASEPFEITWMKHSTDPTSIWYGWNSTLWATPFSGFRWGIPHACGYHGRGIYMDSDVIVLADIAELWNQRMQHGKVALAKGGGSWRYCVSLWDCEAMDGVVFPFERLRKVPTSHREMVNYMASHPHMTQEFQGDWNCLDGIGYTQFFERSNLKALHYTDMRTQPQLKHAIPRLEAQGRKHWFDGQVIPHPRKDVIDLFNFYLIEAIQEGYTVAKYCQDPLIAAPKKASMAGYIGTPR